MDKFSRGIVKSRFVIFIISLVLLIPSFFGYISTRVNYDVLSYLPKDIETMVGQDVLMDDFGTGAFTMIVTEGLPYKDVSKLKEKVEDVDHVKKVIWYDSSQISPFRQSFFHRSYRMHLQKEMRL